MNLGEKGDVRLAVEIYDFLEQSSPFLIGWLLISY